MPLPNAWVDRLFSKLTVTYGQRFLGLYSGVDLQAVKDDWADELSGYAQSPDALRHALSHLPTERPPTVLEFRQLCRQAPRPAAAALPAPALDTQAAKQAASALARPATAYDPKQWARDLARREAWQDAHPRDVADRDRLTAAQRACWRLALGLPSGAAVAEALNPTDKARSDELAAA